MTHIVKRKGHTEEFAHHKLAASIHASCLSVRTPVGEAEVTAKRVVQDILPWLEKKAEVTADDIRRKAAECLSVYNPDAAYMYEQYRVVA